MSAKETEGFDLCFGIPGTIPKRQTVRLCSVKYNSHRATLRSSNETKKVPAVTWCDEPLQFSQVDVSLQKQKNKQKKHTAIRDSLLVTHPITK